MAKEITVIMASRNGWFAQVPLSCLVGEESVKEVYVISPEPEIVDKLARMRELYRRFDKQLHIIVGSMSAIEAKLFGFMRLNEKYVMVLDDDLYFRPGTVDSMFAYLQNLEADAVVGTKIDLFANYGDKDINPANRPTDKPVQVSFLDSAAVIFDVEKAKEKMEIIPEYIDNDMIYGTDFIYFSQIARKGKVYHVPSMFWHLGGGGKDWFLSYSDFASIMTALKKGVATEEDVKRTFGKFYKFSF